MPRIWRFVLTGGPCSGKTNALKKCKKAFEGLGQRVICVPETATEVILSGIRKQDISEEEFQKIILERSILKEDTALRAANILKNKYAEDVVIFYDRGIMDGASYLANQSVFDEWLQDLNLCRQSVLERYDAIIHLVTTADGAESCYNNMNDKKNNNKARSETVEEARESDRKIWKVWEDHKNHIIIENSTSIQKKLGRVLNVVSSIMDER